jgi:hypothetical protein
MQRTLMIRIAVGLLSWLIIAAAQAEGLLWTILPAPGSNPTQTVPENGTANLQYIVQNQSGKSKRLVIRPITGIVQITPCQLRPLVQIGSSCILNLAIIGSALPSEGIHGGPVLCQANLDGSPNPSQCYDAISLENSLNITRGSAAGTIISISVNPTTLVFSENSTGEVTVTNNLNSQTTANNITATIPAGSNISVQSTTCGASLAIGASCTITFASSTPGGPIIIPIAGNNTNTVNVLVTVTSQPQISITSPVQQSRVVPVPGSGGSLALQITNNIGSVVNANNITVSDKGSCPNLIVDATNCVSVAPGSPCTLQLTSDTPYIPCTITVSGSNTANSPTTLIAFFYLGGLVFETGGGSGKVVIDVAQQFTSTWTASNADIPGAGSTADGVANTAAIIVDPSCSNSPGACAAQLCQNINPLGAWYLPAIDEWTQIHTTLCPAGCIFGDFSNSVYWSSTQTSVFGARVFFMPSGTIAVAGKGGTFLGRCIQSF